MKTKSLHDVELADRQQRTVTEFQALFFRESVDLGDLAVDDEIVQLSHPSCSAGSGGSRDGIIDLEMALKAVEEAAWKI